VVKFLFSVHTITEAKQSSRQGGARAVDLPARSFDLAGGPGVAPPLFLCDIRQVSSHAEQNFCDSVVMIESGCAFLSADLLSVVTNLYT